MLARKYLWTVLLCGLSCLTSAGVAAERPLIMVDQFGYLPDSSKVAVLADPQKGFNATRAYTPGSQLEVRRVVDNGVVYTGNPTVWNGGATDAKSGDKAWWFDFSQLQTTGDYYIYDPETTGRSYPFTIGGHVYDAVLKAAMRAFFYQRVNADKLPPYADDRYADAASHGYAEQDFDARAMNPANPAVSDPATSRDLSGGWYDAGDFNKYVNYADGAIHDLLYAYQENSRAWGDDYAIPESGNGIPDVLDELKWELDWLLRMQNTDGSLLHKVTSIDWDDVSPPSTDLIPRRYAPATASATISGAGAFAHAAKVFGAFPEFSSYSAILEEAAGKAWNWLEAHPQAVPSLYDNAGFVTAGAEDCLYGSLDQTNCGLEQHANQVNAAIHLWVLTGEQRFADYIRQHAETDTTLMARGDLTHNGMAAESQDALLYYAAQPGADAALSGKIRSAYKDALSWRYAWTPFSPLARFKEGKDPYRAYLDEYLWGSNQSKSIAGTSLWNVLQYNVPVPEADVSNAKAGADGYLHYLHGVNPHAMVFLSNMGAAGAEDSVPEMYHMWFADNTQWDNIQTSNGPAPGFLVGGPNQYWSTAKVYIDGVQDSDHNLKSQPAMKRYWSWNNARQQSYEITEPAINYQAAYVRLLSKAVTGAGNADTTPDAFSFTNQVGVALSAAIASNPVTISGINSTSAISISGGEYRINGGEYTSATGTINNGDTVQVRHTSSANFRTAVVSRLTIGGIKRNFKSITVKKDAKPDAFSFSALTHVARSTVFESNTITVSGINAPAAIRITKGEYRINGGNYTNAAGTVNNGDTVQLRRTSSSKANTTVTTILRIGGVSGAFKITTTL
ncbi:glycoside hydrolase family 9 protein [Thiothrix nivea]|uniref:Glycoside hydrolase family 9 n=1 Tax=Thiothrix nivea (strain ATCC 35100 / DSM 5205 / JP2) TaxID=870187 RepID=A0A656HDU9_THINJ|nr:glycoside hydrolase family 9 protein [Thiothrix nivea]EIJ34362.1 glycoside hydrolase family 9 [Thiothrix nivea DSM 5205]